MLTPIAQVFRVGQEPDLQDGKWRQAINRKKLVQGCEADGWALSPKLGSLWELLPALCYESREGWQQANKQPDTGLSNPVEWTGRFLGLSEVKRT